MHKLFRFSDETPAFIYDEDALRSHCSLAAERVEEAGCAPLYALKANPLHGVLEIISEFVHGFSASSLFEAKLSRHVLGNRGVVHFVNPGIHPSEISEIAQLCDSITFNSVNQWQTYQGTLLETQRCGLRINPEMPLVQDERYNPCRENSKLGVSFADLKYLQETHSELLAGISGLHFHTNSEATDFSGLLATVRHVRDHFPSLLDKLEWVNIGGGYLFDVTENMDEFNMAIDLFRSDYGLQVISEPGTAMVRKSCYFVSSVIDILPGDGKKIAVLDTTVNHWPEVFEFGFDPDVLGHMENGDYEYILAGRTCLAGDLLGTYASDFPLEIGSKIIFQNAGAYSIVKCHYFNGVNLPSIYALTEGDEFLLKKRFTYEDFVNQMGVSCLDVYENL